MGRFQFEHLMSSVMLSEDALNDTFAKTNHERLTKCWPIFGGSIFTTQILNQRSPLASLFQRFRVGFFSGGYFHLKRVRLAGKSGPISDYWIVVK